MNESFVWMNQQCLADKVPDLAHGKYSKNMRHSSFPLKSSRLIYFGLFERSMLNYYFFFFWNILSPIFLQLVYDIQTLFNLTELSVQAKKIYILFDGLGATWIN